MVEKRKGVMISVYVESKTLRSHHKIHRNNRFRGDRRAQLLSYTHSAHAKPFHNLTPKSKVFIIFIILFKMELFLTSSLSLLVKLSLQFYLLHRSGDSETG